MENRHYIKNDLNKDIYEKGESEILKNLIICDKLMVIVELRIPTMKKMTSFLLRKYSHMSGDKKVRIAFGLSKTVRLVRQAGKKATEGENEWNLTKQNFSK